jgi:hypothetical protein
MGSGAGAATSPIPLFLIRRGTYEAGQSQQGDPFGTYQPGARIGKGEPPTYESFSHSSLIMLESMENMAANQTAMIMTR